MLLKRLLMILFLMRKYEYGLEVLSALYYLYYKELNSKNN